MAKGLWSSLLVSPAVFGAMLIVSAAALAGEKLTEIVSAAMFPWGATDIPSCLLISTGTTCLFKS